MAALTTIIFGFAWWLGLYLVARDPAAPLLRRAGIGLAIYALALAADLLRYAAPDAQLAEMFARAHLALIFVPALCWAGALIRLLPEDLALRGPLDRAWSYSVGPAIVLLGLVVTRPGPSYLATTLLVLTPLLVLLVLVARALRAARPRNATGLAIAATLFFTLGLALLILPLNLLPRGWGLLAIGADLLLFDLAVAALDAFDEGETLLPDIARSFAGALFAALLFGLLVALVMMLAGSTLPLLALLLATVAAAIAMQTFGDPIQSALDRLAFRRAPRLQRERAELRAAASALPRVNAELPLPGLDDAEFTRLVRRALSHYGDLPRLAASPLTRLAIVDERLVARGAPDQPLERAAELKALLAESVARLKPRDRGDFGTTDEWRHYNALYFPYVAGLKPYSRRATADGLDPPALAALEWFGAAVPERTLHNWQNAAARLVARDLRARETMDDGR